MTNDQIIIMLLLENIARMFEEKFETLLKARDYDAFVRSERDIYGLVKAHGHDCLHGQGIPFILEKLLSNADDYGMRQNALRFLCTRRYSLSLMTFNHVLGLLTNNIDDAETVKFCLQMLNHNNLTGSNEFENQEQYFLNCIHNTMMLHEGNIEIQELATQIMAHETGRGVFVGTEDIGIFSTLVRTLKRFQDRPEVVKNVSSLLRNKPDSLSEDVVQILIEASRNHSVHTMVPSMVFLLFQHHIDKVSNFILTEDCIRWYLKIASEQLTGGPEAISLLIKLVESKKEAAALIIDVQGLETLVKFMMLGYSSEPIIVSTVEPEPYSKTFYKIITLLGTMCEALPETAARVSDLGLVPILLMGIDTAVAWIPSDPEEIPKQRAFYELLCKIVEGSPKEAEGQISEFSDGLERIVAYELLAYCTSGSKPCISLGLAASCNSERQLPLHHVASLVNNPFAFVVLQQSEQTSTFLMQCSPDPVVSSVHCQFKNFVTTLRNANPSAVLTYDETGCLPVHYALKVNANLNVLESFLEGDSMKCQATGHKNMPLPLYAASIGCNLDTIFFLTRRSPQQLKTIRAKKTCRKRKRLCS